MFWMRMLDVSEFFNVCVELIQKRAKILDFIIKSRERIPKMGFWMKKMVQDDVRNGMIQKQTKYEKKKIWTGFCFFFLFSLQIFKFYVNRKMEYWISCNSKMKSNSLFGMKFLCILSFVSSFSFWVCVLFELYVYENTE